MPIFIPDLFTSYINGRRQAVADNWQDLSNYNQVAAGQLNNAFNMATFDPRVRIAESQAQLGEQNAALGGAMTDQNLRHIAAQNKLNIPDLSASAQQALFNHNIKLLTDPDYARTYYALGLGLGLGIPQAKSTQNGTINTGLNVQNGYGLNGASANANANANAQQPSSTNAGK